MTEYEFALHVFGLNIEDAAQIARLDDEFLTVVPSQIDGNVMLEVILTAKSERIAWALVTSFLAERGPEISIRRVDLDLVTIPEIAFRFGVDRETVRLWAKGQRRAGFPLPFGTAGQSQLWAWSDVFKWASADQVAGQPTPLSTTFVEILNGSLASAKAMTKPTWVVAVRLTHLKNARRPMLKSDVSELWDTKLGACKTLKTQRSRIPA